MGRCVSWDQFGQDKGPVLTALRILARGRPSAGGGWWVTGRHARVEIRTQARQRSTGAVCGCKDPVAGLELVFAPYWLCDLGRAVTSGPVQ